MSKLTPLMVTIIENKGGIPDQWKAAAEKLVSKPEEAKYFANFIKTKVKDLDESVQLITLDLLDYLTVNANMPVYTQIAANDFLNNLINITKTRHNEEVNNKIFYLIRKWALKFENQKDIIPNFTEKYNYLKQNGVVFPEYLENTYHKYVGGSQEVYSQEPKISKENSSYEVLDPSKYEKFYEQFVKELTILVDTISLANEIIDNTNHKSGVDESLRVVIHNIREMEKNLVSAIQEKIKNEKLMDVCLALNDDIIKTLARYNSLKMKNKPNDFTSSLKKENKNIKKEIISKSKNDKNNLIDLFEVGNNIQVNENANNFNFKNQSSKNNQQDLLMDIFSGSNSIPQNNNQNVSSNQINKSEDLFGFSNGINLVQNEIPVNINQLSQQNNKKEVNLNDLLKKAYNNEPAEILPQKYDNQISNQYIPNKEINKPPLNMQNFIGNNQIPNNNILMNNFPNNNYQNSFPMNNPINNFPMNNPINNFPMNNPINNFPMNNIPNNNVPMNQMLFPNNSNFNMNHNNSNFPNNMQNVNYPNNMPQNQINKKDSYNLYPDFS